MWKGGIRTLWIRLWIRLWIMSSECGGRQREEKTKVLTPLAKIAMTRRHMSENAGSLDTFL